MAADSNVSTRLLQAQFDEQKEKWKKEQQDLQKINKEKISELEKTQITVRSLKEEVSKGMQEFLFFFFSFPLKQSIHRISMSLFTPGTHMYNVYIVYIVHIPPRVKLLTIL